MREELFNSVDPLTMRAYYESLYFPTLEPSIKIEDIEVDFKDIITHKELRKAIARALSLRVWHKHILIEAQDEINDILIILNE